MPQRYAGAQRWRVRPDDAVDPGSSLQVRQTGPQGDARGSAGMTRRHVIDVHSHIGRTVSNGRGQDVQAWLAKMDAVGIAQAIISVAAGGVQAEGLLDTRL